MRVISAAALGVLGLALLTLLVGTAQADANVDVGNNFYSPSSVTIGTGESVTWTWVAGFHSVTFDTPGSSADCGGTSSGSCSRAFPTAGTFAYHCAFHSNMAGSVTVNAPPPPNAAPTAAFTRSVSGRTVSVDGSGSSDDGSVASWSWSWGDGSGAGSGATASHAYASPGTFTITLTVTDNLGVTGSTSQQVTITNAAPTASFTASASDLTVSVNGGASTDPDGSVASFAWTFGDGGSATGASASHAYASAGTFTITLTVTDNDGGTASASQQVSVTAPAPPPPPPPAVVYEAPVPSFTSTVDGLNVTVDAGGSTDADGTIVGFAWDFGDNATATGVNRTHAYAAAGNYTVRLSVTDDDGLVRSLSQNVTVKAPPPPVVDPVEETIVTPTPVEDPADEPTEDEPAETDEAAAAEEPTPTTPAGTDAPTDGTGAAGEPAGDGLVTGAEVEATPTDATLSAPTPGAPMVALIVAVAALAAVLSRRR